ncbi:LAME_0E07448g1_1 [Lachancea meyersii CBS 8951]|uniref:LAME_0E07448g1_1 n=1 Tax=Lachancea meyersii CBS 8951 TaxID=1266667 RepID=A0A1G4JIJ4_9SACH|nr:LAME_0E07448g1_1 [Lachancea meyersii CBS 8951]
MASPSDPNEAYRQTQFQIYNLQQTLLNSSKATEIKTTDSQQPVENASTTANGSANDKNATFEDVAPVKIDSRPILDLVTNKFGRPHKRLGAMRYNPWKTGVLDFKPEEIAAASATYGTVLSSPPPFLPAFGFANINALVTVHVRCEELMEVQSQPSSNPRIANNELWGAQIYTDDSDPLLALQHCAVVSRDAQGHLEIDRLRTPANIENPDNVTGDIPPGAIPYDLKIDLLLLPPLQNYASAACGGIRSRSWTTGHDGLSYGIYAIEVIPRDQSLQSIEPKDEIKAVQWA